MKRNFHSNGEYKVNVMKNSKKKEKEKMMDVICGILLLLTFIALIVYCIKGGNLLIGFIVTAVLWCIIGQVPIQTVVKDIFAGSVAAYGDTIAIIIFGAWFGRALVDTGIAGYIIKKTVELAGDKPLVTTIALNLVCMLIFTSAFGVGSVMAIGMIVLPILVSMGVNKKIAAGAYLIAVAGGMWLNIAYVSQFFAVFDDITYDNRYISFGIIATVVHAVILLAYILFYFKKDHPNPKKMRAWAMPSQSSNTDNLKGYVMLVPFIPIVMVAIFKWLPVPSFLVGITLALLLTGNFKTYKKAVDKIQKTLYDGVADSGLLIGMLYSVNIFQAAARANAPLLQKLLGDVIPNSPIILLIGFIILAPLALFRGPLMIWGSGIALASILQAMGAFDSAFLFMIFLVPPVTIVACSCPTQSWTMWALNYEKIDSKDHIFRNLPFGWILTAIILVSGYLFYYL